MNAKLTCTINANNARSYIGSRGIVTFWQPVGDVVEDNVNARTTGHVAVVSRKTLLCDRVQVKETHFVIFARMVEGMSRGGGRWDDGCSTGEGTQCCVFRSAIRCQKLVNLLDHFQPRANSFYLLQITMAVVDEVMWSFGLRNETNKAVRLVVVLKKGSKVDYFFLKTKVLVQTYRFTDNDDNGDDKNKEEEKNCSNYA